MKPDLEAIRKRLEAATPGPWNWVIEDYSMATLGTGDYPGNDGTGESKYVLNVSVCSSCLSRITGVKDKVWRWDRCNLPKEPDAAFIAHAPADISTLLEWCEKLEAVKVPLPALLKAIAGSQSGKNLRLYVEPIFKALAALEAP